MSRKAKSDFPTTLVGLAAGSAALLVGFVWLAMPPVAKTQMTPDKMSTRVSHLEEGAPIVSVVLPDEFSTKAQEGEKAFEANCASCHGSSAVGQNGVAPPLVHKVYEPMHHSDLAFHMAAGKGVRSHHWSFGDMPKIETVTQEDIGQIVTYIRELQRANGIQ